MRNLLVIQKGGRQPQDGPQGSAQVLAVFLRLDAVTALFLVLFLILDQRSSIQSAPKAKAQESISPRVNRRAIPFHRR